MKMLKTKFLQKSLPIIFGLCSVCAMETDSIAARVAIRGSGIANNVATATAVTETPAPVATPTAVTPKESYKTSSNEFAKAFQSAAGSTSGSSSLNSELADTIKRQRDSIKALEQRDLVEKQLGGELTGGKNRCDAGLRKCMSEKCGTDFTKCATDGDTMFGDKINACKRDLPCSGEEIKLFSTEIKADRDLNVRLSSYNKIIECGNAYNDCMVTECAKKYDVAEENLYNLPWLNKANFDKCLDKADADAAAQKCKKIADKCKEQDSGLPGRFGTVIGKLRETAESQIKESEQRMYALRDLMKSACNRLGAMFDERTFDCVYTVHFYAGEDAKTPMASRKRYAGDLFVCQPEWFGVDVTTYKENAYRETRMQTAATSAMLGSGVGLAASMVTSGSIGRALDTQKAKTALDSAKAKECQKDNGGMYDGSKCIHAGEDCAKNHGTGKYEKRGKKMVCALDTCKKDGYVPNNAKTKCISKKDKEKDKTTANDTDEAAAEEVEIDTPIEQPAKTPETQDVPGQETANQQEVKAQQLNTSPGTAGKPL